MNGPTGRPGAETGGAEQRLSRLRLILFVVGRETNSQLARGNLEKFQAQGLNGVEMDLQIVDVMDDMDAAIEHEILVTPSLLILEPPPRRLVIGNLSDTNKLREALAVSRS
ncbi:MAG: circadian clock KaiB family protein [Candidatus Krumholzibacteriia bacterium]